MINPDIIKLKYPDADFTLDIQLQDDGEGVYIAYWGLNEPKPTIDDLNRWEIEFAEAYQFKQNKIANQPIYDQLDQIDFKSIRALRANDTDRLAELEAEAVALRAQLLPVS